MKLLDFIVIGAQKSGTTALHMYLRENPNICVPPEKEAIFFSDDSRYEKGYEWFESEFFSGFDYKKIWGKATPAYSCYSEKSSLRIKEHNNEVKIIYLVRDPVSRSISQFRMNKKRGVESRDINELFVSLADNGEAERCREMPTETNSYLVWSEYTRILRDYCWVRPGNLLVMSDEYLSNSTDEAMKVISKFLGVGFNESEIYGKRFHTGGVRKYKAFDVLRKITALKILWRLIIPFRYRRRISFWLDQWNTKQDSGRVVVMDIEVKRLLEVFFEKECTLINDLNNNGGYIIR